MQFYLNKQWWSPLRIFANRISVISYVAHFCRFSCTWKTTCFSTENMERMPLQFTRESNHTYEKQIIYINWNFNLLHHGNASMWNNFLFFIPVNVPNLFAFGLLSLSFFLSVYHSYALEIHLWHSYVCINDAVVDFGFLC